MMSGNAKRKLIALIALSAILLFTYGAANHWHSSPAQDADCQVCHLAHSVSLGVVPAPPLCIPAPVSRLVLGTLAELDFDAHVRPASSRAPPAFAQLA